MFRKLNSYFNRYVKLHGKIEMAGFDLKTIDGKVFGVVEMVAVREDRLIVDGWCFSDSVGLTCAGHSDRQTPSLERADVTNIHRNIEDYPTPGFSLSVHHEEGNRLFMVSHNEKLYDFALHPYDPADSSRMRRKQIIPFMSSLIRVFPSAVRWYLLREFAARTRVKYILGFNPKISPMLLNEKLFLATGSPPAKINMQTEITIVLPVYNAFNLLEPVLARVLAHTDLPYRLIIIEDKSTDQQVRPFLRNWHSALESRVRGRIEVLENAENLGFIQSVNRALKRAAELDNHVVLLNSDTFVPQGWASRLLTPLLADDDVATVTPMSNDAEIFNVPIICQRNDLGPGVADKIDAVAQQFSPDVYTAEAPTGVGFCMAMNLKFLKLEPELDTVFGRGYGEEVDWCRRVKARGGRHLGHAGVFVEHRGGESFGSEEKLKLVRSNGDIISRRYPNFDELVQDFIRIDPLQSGRLALALAWADGQAGAQNSGPVPVYLAHDMGGGAENYLERQINQNLDVMSAVVVIRVGGLQHWKVEVHTAQGIVAGEFNKTEFLHELMAILSARAVVYSCGVGGHDAVALPALLQELSVGGGHNLTVLIHDYFPVSPSYTLLDSDGVYRGVPASDNTDPAHQFETRGGYVTTLQAWRTAWEGTMQAADHVEVFSQNSADLLIEAYPDIVQKLRVVPHQMLYDVPQIARVSGRNKRPVIGVLGNIGVQKGAKILQKLSLHLAQTEQASLVVIGNMDPAYMLSAPAQIHGSYKLADLPGLVKKYGITDWLMPSVWPETFSYVVHEVLATGMPVWAFDLGAQGDAARAAATERKQGGVIPLDLQSPQFSPMLDMMFKDIKGSFCE